MTWGDKHKSLQALERAVKGLKCIQSETDLKKIRKYTEVIISLVREAEERIDNRSNILSGILMDEILDKEVS